MPVKPAKVTTEISKTVSTDVAFKIPFDRLVALLNELDSEWAAESGEYELTNVEVSEYSREVPHVAMRFQRREDSQL